MPALFRDRTDAGERLATALLRFRGPDVLVLGLSRGGVPVAREVAQALGAELDVLVARKLGAPGHAEFGVGAIARGVRYVDAATVRALGITDEELDAIEARERAELERRERAYRGARPAPRIARRTVIVVDDGVATGGTARAALRSVRALGPARVVFAAPVGPADAHSQLAAEADDVVLLETPQPFQAVGLWYERFDQTSDEEVLSILASREAPADAPAEVRVPAGRVELAATLAVPSEPIGLVIFAHGSGSSRFSPRNGYVARVLQERGLATLLLDLLTTDEEQVDDRTREHRFDIALLADRLVEAARWARAQPPLADLRIGFFGSSTGGAAALVAAAQPEVGFDVAAVVSRGGRPDLAGDALPDVRAPTLLLVGGRDEVVIRLNEEARARMQAPVELRIVPGATHLFEEPGTLEEVAAQSAGFFVDAMTARARATRPMRA